MRHSRTLGIFVMCGAAALGVVPESASSPEFTGKAVAILDGDTIDVLRTFQ